MTTNLRCLLLALLLASCGGGPDYAANVLTFTASNTTGTGTVTPVLTWSTAPVATSCTASGDWAGVKAASGTETLAPVNVGKTYNLTCTWTDTTATVSWVPPTQNTNGTPYTDPQFIRIYFGQSATTMTSQLDLPPTTVTRAFTALTPGTWFFGAKAVNLLNQESAMSNVVSKVIGTATGSKSIGITVNPVPAAPTAVTVQ